MLGQIEPKFLMMMIFAFLTAITVHEYAHGRAALASGDDTAKQAGRLTLNPLAHLDLMGSIFFLLMLVSGFGIGWAKPVPVNPSRFKNPRWDNFKVSIWGPLSNMIMACVLAVILRLFGDTYAHEYIALLLLCIRVNVGLAVFNILPIPPLDGSHILASLMPLEMGRRFEYASARYGFTILIILVLSRQITHVSIIGLLVGRPIDTLFTFLTGVQF